MDYKILQKNTTFYITNKYITITPSNKINLGKWLKKRVHKKYQYTLCTTTGEITLISVIIRKPKTGKRSVLKMKVSCTLLIPTSHLSFVDARFFFEQHQARHATEPGVVSRLY